MKRLTNSDKEIPTLCNNAEYWLQAYFKLKEYEDLEEQGLLLKLPCKVGDTAFVDSKTIPTKNMEFEEVKEVPLFFEAKVDGKLGVAYESYIAGRND